MKGNCKDCAKRETCTKNIGKIYGYCNTDFMPAIENITCYYVKED